MTAPDLHILSGYTKRERIGVARTRHRGNRNMLAAVMARGVHAGRGMTWRYVLVVVVAMFAFGCPRTPPSVPRTDTVVDPPSRRAAKDAPGFRLSNADADAD